MTRQGQTIELRPREFALLEYLMRNAGRVVSKTMILSRIWDYSFDPRTNVVDVLVHRLREKIDHDFEPKLLQTRRGMGYVLEVPARPAADGAADPGHRVARSLGVRLAFGYGAIFVASTLLISVLAYRLLERSLIERDHEIVRVKLADYAPASTAPASTA